MVLEEEEHCSAQAEPQRFSSEKCNTSTLCYDMLDWWHFIVFYIWKPCDGVILRVCTLLLHV